MHPLPFPKAVRLRKAAIVGASLFIWYHFFVCPKNLIDIICNFHKLPSDNKWNLLSHDLQDNWIELSIYCLIIINIPIHIILSLIPAGWNYKYSNACTKYPGRTHTHIHTHKPTQTERYALVYTQYKLHFPNGKFLTHFICKLNTRTSLKLYIHPNYIPVTLGI